MLHNHGAAYLLSSGELSVQLIFKNGSNFKYYESPTGAEIRVTPSRSLSVGAGRQTWQLMTLFSDSIWQQQQEPNML